MVNIAAKLRATIPAIIAIRKINKTILRINLFIIYGLKSVSICITTQSGKLTYMGVTIQSNLRSIPMKVLRYLVNVN